ncbi:hypothetical protein [Bacillus cereus group sp. BY6-1LC]|uniref:hypothetical protein n=1 Tax=Bacillus cereus group sp. BY6-1LC TaxID=3018077 RepID=UPI0022E1D481|nr:hypothetical protein [Bacillus cereus group sp. BY6-1LC]MDA1802864.1 hypothetical protein [Bacillus cereus group sp. BY6-1LC]
MQFVTEEEIQSLELETLISRMLATFIKKEFEMEFVDVPSYFRFKEIMGIDDVKGFLKFDVPNAIYIFPSLDERELMNVPTFKEKRILPPKGFFWVLKTEKEEKMFGIVDVMFTINKVSIKPNDERYEQMNVVFRDEKNFYFDYEKSEYVQVNKKQASNENTQEYLRRIELKDKCFERLGEENDRYLEILLNASEHLVDKNTLYTVEGFHTYFQDYLAIYESIKDYLALKILFNQTDVSNYSHIKTYFEDLNANVSERITDFAELKEQGIIGDLRENDMKPYLSYFNSFENTRKKIRNMFRYRDEFVMKTKKAQDPLKKMDGYYAFDEKRMYANLMQIENDYSYKTQAGTKEQREKAVRELHENMVASVKAVQSEKQTDKYDVLTAEQKEELAKLTGRDKKNQLLKFINELIREKKIDPLEKVLYLERYM